MSQHRQIVSGARLPRYLGRPDRVRVAANHQRGHVRLGQVVAKVGAEVGATDNADASHDRPVRCRLVDGKGSGIGVDAQLRDDLDVTKDDDDVVVCQNRGTRLHDRGSNVVGLGEVGHGPGAVDQGPGSADAPSAFPRLTGVTV